MQQSTHTKLVAARSGKHQTATEAFYPTQTPFTETILETTHYGYSTDLLKVQPVHLPVLAPYRKHFFWISWTPEPRVSTQCSTWKCG